MKLMLCGGLLLVGLGTCLIVSGCNDDYAPCIEICTGDGFGGASCLECDNSEVYKAPSSLKNYWLTNQPDMVKLTSWCYGITPSEATKELEKVRLNIQQ